MLCMHSALYRCSRWTLFAILVWSGCDITAQSDANRFPSIDLRSYGWEAPTRREVDSPSLAIDHAGRVLVAFTVRERPGLVTREQPSLSLRILRFSTNGKLNISLSRPTNDAGRAGIYLSDTDQIIARANGSLQIFQADDSDSQEGTWKVLAPCSERCHVQQSATRHTLLLYTEGSDDPPLTVIRLSSPLEPTRCGKASKFIDSDEKFQNYPQSISDQYAYFERQEVGVGEYTYRWPLCEFGKRTEMPLHIKGRWVVLNDSVFVVNTDVFGKGQNYHGLEVMSSRGQVTFRPTMEKHESAESLFAPIRSNDRGDRIAVHMLTVRGMNNTLDISGHVTARRIAVFDINAGKELASIPLNPKPRGHSEFEFSPDGHWVAIWEGETVRLVPVDAP